MNYVFGSGYLNAYKSDGTVITRDANTQLMTLVAATYYVPLGTSSQSVTPAQTALTSAHCAWNAALAATITVETSNMPLHSHGFDAGPVWVSDFEATTVGGNWVPENPSTAIVSVTGSSNTSTAATVTAGGAAIGAAMFHLGNMGARRVRLKVVVTVGGTLAVNVNGKAGA